MNSIATITRPNKYNNQWIAEIASDNGELTSKRTATRAEAVQFIHESGAQLLNNKAFWQETDYRRMIARKSSDVYYNYASNG